LRFGPSAAPDLPPPFTHAMRTTPPADLLFERRRRVLEALGDDALLLPAAPVRYASRDAEYPYRPDSELYWLTGMVEPGGLALLRGHADADRFVLFVPDRDLDAELWHGPRTGPDEAAERFGADAAWPLDELEERLPPLLYGAERLYLRLEPDAKGGRSVRGRVERLAREALAWGRRRGARTGVGPRGVLDPGGVLDPLRIVKDGWEIDRMRAAAALTVEAHRHALAGVAPGVGEWEVQARVEARMRGEGGDGPAFGTIVASGPNACTLHYVANDRRIGDGELVLLDAGASLDLYAGDVTRTVPADGTFTGARRAVYEWVDGARRAAIAAAEPGATVDDVHDAAVRTIVEGLIELGALDGAPDDLVESKAFKRYFPHSTSHWLGLDVHDPGDYGTDGESRMLEAGMVLTVEPGLYFVPEAAARSRGRDRGHGMDTIGARDEPAGADLPELPEALRGIGVRVEDDLLITVEGCEVLTADLPTGADEVAALVRGDR